MKINKQNIILKQNKKKIHFTKELKTYYKEDYWEFCNHPRFKENQRNRKVDFSIIKDNNLKNELKYYVAFCIENDLVAATTIFETRLPKLFVFINYLNSSNTQLASFSKIDNRIKLNYYQYIVKTYSIKETRGFENTSTPWKNETKIKNPYMSILDNIVRFFVELYDERTEVEKDIWDVRKLGLDYNKTTAKYYLKFDKIPSNFRELYKKYMHTKLIKLQSITFATSLTHLDKITYFFVFFTKKYPSLKQLNHLKRDDIENFIDYLRNEMKVTDNVLHRTLSCLEVFLTDIQRLEWKEAPKKSVHMLIFDSDRPKKHNKKPDDIKYIPDDIWDVVLNNISELPKNMQLMTLLLEATGFRISDVATLRTDCLVEREDGFWIRGDQRKVNEKGHRVPVSIEIAELVNKQLAYLKTLNCDKITKNNLLLPVETGKRKGQPILNANYTEHLDKIAYKFGITNKNGSPYRFKVHSFRHRYGVNLINNGMNILHVQKLMAHTSPEMTLVYAQIKDDTLRKEWEKAKSKGAVMLDISGNVVEADIEKQAEENGLELEWLRHNLDSIRLDHGFCIKSPKTQCSFLEQVIEPPCIKNNCKSFHVDTTFSDYYTEQINKMEADLEIYKKSGRERSIELIMPKITRYKEIRDGIIANGGIYGISKEKREVKKDV